MSNDSEVLEHLRTQLADYPQIAKRPDILSALCAGMANEQGRAELEAVFDLITQSSILRGKLSMHPKLLAGWSIHEAPARHPELTVVKLTLDYGHRWHMDFSREENGDRWYASDVEKCPAIAWPWIEGFEPTFQDWKEIGFVVTVEIRDHAGEIRPRSHSTDQVLAVVKDAMFEDAAAKTGALKDSGNA